MPFTPADLAGNLYWARSSSLTAGAISSWPNLATTSVTASTSGTTVTAAITPSSGQAVRCVTGAINFNHISGIFATSQYNSIYWVGNLVDGNSATSWASSAYSSQNLVQELETAAAATAYTIAAEGSAVARCPSAWTFAGSNDNSSYTTLDTQSGISFSGTTAQQFTFSNVTAYKFYRLTITATPTGSGEIWMSRFTVDGVSLLGPACEIWRVIKSNDTSGQAAALGDAGSASHYTFSGVVYDDTFSRDRQSFTSSLAVTSWRLYRVVSDAGTWKADVDNVNQNTTGSRPLTMNTNPRLIASWSGDIAEVLVRDRVSTSGEIADLITYFNTEHGLTVAGGSVGGATTGTAPITVGSTSATTMPAVTTGTAPITVASSAATAVPSVTTGTAPITVGSSSATTTPIVTTGTAPITVASTSATIFIQGPLATWTGDLSQQAVAEFTSPAAILYVEAPAAEPPATIVERTILRNSIMLDPMTVDTDTGRVDPASFDATITGEVGVYHVTVDGIDVTYWRDAPTVIGQMHFSEPGGEDSTRLEFPQITSIDEAGTGDLAWLHTDAPVEIFILTPEGDRIHKFSGHLVSDNTGIGTALQSSWDVQGNIRQGDSIVHRVPTILDRTDIGVLVPKYLNEVPGRRYASIPPATTGITSKQRGSYSDTEWDYSQTLLGGAYELDGDQWTLTRSGINQYGIALKDRDTVHWTVTAGTPGVEFDLTEDVANLVNCIYGRGVGPDGYAWAGWCHPNLLPDDAPIYPMFPITDLIEVGVDDADTTTGEGVTTWQRRVQSLGYSVTVDGVYSSADATVARQVQTDYGLLVDGKVGPQTWAASFDVGSGGGDLNGSYRRPLAITSAVDPYLYAANGAIVGANPDYDPAIIRRERNVDYGTGITKAEATILANMELARDSVTGWQGSITFKVDPREGSRHLMREGQNILLQGFRGADVLLHISELSVDPSNNYMPVTVAVDSKARDAMSLSSVAQRDRDSRADPARRPGNPARRSRQEQDMAVEYDGESGAGVIPHFAVYGGLWSVIRIPVSEVGNVKLTLATTSGPVCEFSIGFFGLPLTPAHMNSLVGNPFTSGAWDTNAEVMDEQYAFLESFGNDSQACGYYPGGVTLTGRLKDTGSWEYISGKPPHIWVAIYATSTCFIEGRVYPAPVV